MRCLDKFNKKMNINGQSLRDEHILNSQMLLRETFADDASFTFGVYFWRLGLKDFSNEKPIGIRLYGRTFSAANGVRVNFQTLYDTPVDVGDIIYDSSKDEYLICTESFDIDGINFQGKFTLCNWILKWQNKNGDILEYPCYDTNTTQYNSGEMSNRNFVIQSAQHMITLPSDENTVNLMSPQRFYLDKNKEHPSSYIVTQNDNTSYNYGKKGLVKLTVYIYPNSKETDRPDLGVCDYVDFSEKKDKYCCNTLRTIIEYDTNVIKSGGDLQTFIAKFYDENGNLVENVVPHWTIVCDFADKLDIKEFDNSISIGIDDDSYIDEEFKLVCFNEDDEDKNLSDTIIVKVESLL